MKLLAPNQLLLLPLEHNQTPKACIVEEVLVTNSTCGKRKRPEHLPSKTQISSTLAAPASPVSYLSSLLSTPPRTNKRQRISNTAPATVTATTAADSSKKRTSMEAGYDMESVAAIRSMNIAKLQVMLKAGKSFHACNSNGESLLHLACRRANVETVRFLVGQAAVDANVRDNMGRSVLHDVCWRSTPNVELMAVLLPHVSPSLLLAKDVRGHTPFDYARKQHRNVWIAFLQQRKEQILWASSPR